MVSLLTKADLELELKYTFPASYTSDYFLEIANYALGELYTATNRTTFTGQTEYMAKKAMVCAAVEWISIFDPLVCKAVIKSITEDGKTINLSEGNTLKNFKTKFDKITAKLALPSAGNFNIIMPDIDGTHDTTTDGNVLY